MHELVLDVFHPMYRLISLDLLLFVLLGSREILLIMVLHSLVPQMDFELNLLLLFVFLSCIFPPRNLQILLFEIAFEYIPFLNLNH